MTAPAVASPPVVLSAHVAAMLASAGALWAALTAARNDAPLEIGITLAVLGETLATLAWRSYSGSRAAWAFLATICGVMTVITGFGAGAIGRALHVSLGTALVVPLFLAVSCALLAACGSRYRERS